MIKGVLGLSLIIIIIVSIFMSTTIKYDAPIPVKILIILAFILVIFLLLAINEISENQRTLLYFLRNIYISVETSRLDPNSNEPSRDILKKDLEMENAEEELKKEILRLWGLSINIFIPVIFLVSIMILTYIFLKNWYLFVAFFSFVGKKLLS